MSARTCPYPSGSASAGLDAASWNDVVRTARVTGLGVARIADGALAVLHVPGIAAGVVLVVGNAAVDWPIVVVALPSPVVATLVGDGRGGDGRVSVSRLSRMGAGRCDERRQDDCDYEQSTYAHLTPSWMIDRNTTAAAGSSCTSQSR
jgi:hypothetical protein